LEEERTNNQVEYETLLFGLVFLGSMGVKHVEAYVDSLLMVQQVSRVCQCYNVSLNGYLDRCLDIISCFDEFVIRHIPRDSNQNANALAQQVSVYNVTKKYFNMRKPIRATAELLVLGEPV
jgi:ribonuclease HI